MTLSVFENIYSNHIAYYYTENQIKFDSDSIHGCLHISRSLIICRWISNELNKKGIKTDIDAISYAVAFHDSGRKSNGIDYYENDSSLICHKYLSKIENYNADYISSLIIKNNKNNYNNYDFLCMYDTDVLEILRPSTGIGLQGFNRSYLKLKDIINYDVIFNEVLTFILETEKLKEEFLDNNSLFNMIQYLKLNKIKYPNLYVCTNT